MSATMCAYRLRIGLAMLILQGISFLLFVLGAVLLINDTISNLPLLRAWRPTPSDKFAAAVHEVMMRVCPRRVWHAAQT